MTENRINWVTAIVNKGRGLEAAGLFEKNFCSVLAIARGHGTASSYIMDCLGLDQPEKELVIGMATRDSSRELLEKLNRELEFKRPGKGIAFSVPLSGISLGAAHHVSEPISARENTFSHAADANRTNNSRRTGGAHKEDFAMEPDVHYELIAAVISSDLADPVMDAARKAGCQGGTLVKARDLGNTSKKLLGLNFSQEKDILLILTPDTSKRPILSAICETIKRETGEHAAAFSLPVTEVMGITGGK